MNFSVVEVNETNFNNEVINQSTTKPVLVYFYAPWCPHCQELTPRLETVASEYNLVLAKVNVDQNLNLTQSYGVQSFPTVQLFNNGLVTDGFLGALPTPSILNFFSLNEIQPIDLVRGGINNDTLSGGLGNDKIAGGFGDDRLLGEGGDDRLYGNSGNDNLLGGSGKDYLWGGIGRDTISGGINQDYLWGGSDNDSLLGGDGNDLLYGESGNDTLIAEVGDDTLVGVDELAIAPGRGEIDRLTGNAGSDSFVLGVGDRVFYDDGSQLNLGTTDYAIISDFTLNQDVIILPRAFKYSLNSYSIQGQSGTGIFVSNNQGSDELIAIVPNLEPLSLDSRQFVFI